MRDFKWDSGEGLRCVPVWGWSGRRWRTSPLCCALSSPPPPSAGVAPYTLTARQRGRSISSLADWSAIDQLCNIVLTVIIHCVCSYSRWHSQTLLSLQSAPSSCSSSSSNTSSPGPPPAWKPWTTTLRERMRGRSGEGWGGWNRRRGRRERGNIKPHHCLTDQASITHTGCCHRNTTSTAITLTTEGFPHWPESYELLRISMNV